MSFSFSSCSFPSSTVLVLAAIALSAVFSSNSPSPVATFASLRSSSILSKKMSFITEKIPFLSFFFCFLLCFFFIEALSACASSASEALFCTLALLAASVPLSSDVLSEAAFASLSALPKEALSADEAKLSADVSSAATSSSDCIPFSLRSSFIDDSSALSFISPIRSSKFILARRSFSVSDKPISSISSSFLSRLVPAASSTGVSSNILSIASSACLSLDVSSASVCLSASCAFLATSSGVNSDTVSSVINVSSVSEAAI